jgi:hypothetical protein
MDTKKFDLLADRYTAMSEELSVLRAEVANEAVEIYKQGVKIIYITDTLNVSVATIYKWIKGAGQDGSVVLRKPGRPRKFGSKDTETRDPDPLPKLADDYEFAWLDDKVRVDSGKKRVLIDVERIEFEGDKDLGQLLVSGTDINLLRKFNNFINGK